MVKRGGAAKRKLPVQVTVVGIDPGFAKVGIGVVAREVAGRIVCLDAKLLVTKKGVGKRIRDFRVSDDDLRRLSEIYGGILAMIEHHQPAALAYEVYSPYGKQGGNAWKVGRIEGVIASLGLATEVMTFPFVPQDLKRRVAGKLSASKIDVAEQIGVKVVGAKEAIDSYAKSNREHIADAIGIAYLGLLEVESLRSVLRISGD